MIDIDTAKIESIIRHVSATEVMPRFNNLRDEDIRQKKPGDFVTVADEASERVLSKLLHEALPGSLVVGEEAVSKDPSVLNRLKEDNPVWVIDPIDGTYNYSHNIPRFGILIALVQNGVTQYGWAYDAPRDHLFFAKKGGGTFRDGKKLQIICNATDMKQLTGQGGGANVKVYNAVRPYFKELIHNRCSLYDFTNFLSGEVNFVIHLNKITPWDHAAAMLMVQEAGGYVAINKADESYDPTYFGPAFTLAAPSREWWQKLHAVLYPQLCSI